MKQLFSFNETWLLLAVAFAVAFAVDIIPVSYGSTFMGSIFLAFACFGIWAVRRTKKKKKP